MPDVTLRIKNLSISLEAVSRVNNKRSSSLYTHIERLLREEILKAAKENKPSPKTAILSTDDDNIPF